jgi:hypothetical protein
MIDWTIVGIVVFAVLAIYVVERITRQKKINAGSAIKLGVLSAGLTSGVLYAIDEDIVTTVTTIKDTAQDMFVGKPSF